MQQKPLILVLGIRPDVIRASIMIRELRSRLKENFILVWSGQHYSENLKDVFFKELGILAPDVELNISGSNDAEISTSMITQLYKYLEETQPIAAVFLGDTNTVIGTLAAAQLNIPIVHIEGCMRSYDWRMPEEKYRTIADHLSDRIYAYTPEYKSQGVAEGIPDQNIIVTGNPIVDVLEEYFLSGKLRMTDSDFVDLLENKYKIQSKDFLVMTCHRRENVEDLKSLSTILELAKQTKHPVLFPAGYRTQKMLQEFDLTLPSNIVMVDPVGYLELLELMVASKGILTDSGTVVEEASVLGVPTIQMRKSTERPEVYISKSSVKFDPSDAPDIETTLKLFFALEKNGWTHLFGDGKASYRIVDDLVLLFNQQNFRGHQPEKYEPYSKRSFMN